MSDFVSIRDLSGWLAAYAMPPAYAVDDVLGGSMDAQVPAERCAAAWEYHIRNLIDCGLLSSPDSEGENICAEPSNDRS